MKKYHIIPLLALLIPAGAGAQQTLTLDECRQMAVSGNKELEQSRQQVRMADYDKKIALANYFPNISATGAYAYNSRNISLVSDETASALANLGTTVQGQLSGQMQQLMTAITSNPAAAKEYMQSPMWQTVMGAMSQTDVTTALNAIGTQIGEAFQLDIQNTYAGVISVQQPLFLGGKIVSSNKMAALAQELARSQYDTQYQEILVGVDQAYWQIVSISNKKRLAEDYADLLGHMMKDTEISVEEGVAVQSDLLSIKVKYNEAQMLLAKSTNGLALSKMLLCKQIGLPLDSDITLADEALDAIPTPDMLGGKSIEEVLEDRPEARSLELASKIYEQKVNIARADMMPKVVATANYLVSNPSCYNGFQNSFGGMFNAGVMVMIPIMHGTEALQKVHKAQAQAEIYRSRYDEACDMIHLQVEQLTKQQQEAWDKLLMAESNLANAEENQRAAMVGYEEGVISANVALAAQTAWVQAHSEYIDAGIELQMNHANLLKAQGAYSTDEL